MSTHPKRRGDLTAFTLIEMLVVIAIIAALAALIFPIGVAINRAKIRSRTQTELAEIAFAIDSYKEKFGHLPPDNPGDPLMSPLYFELLGTTNDGVSFSTLDGTATVQIGNVNSPVPAGFGPGVIGFVNCSRGSGDEAVRASKLVTAVKPGRFAEPAPGLRILTASTAWPSELPPLIPGAPGANPWRYNMSSPTHNPGSYDLWLDVVLGGKTNRICNWNSKVLYL